MKAYKFIVTICLVFNTCITVYGQEIYVVAFKGKVSFSDGRVLVPNFRYAIPTGNATVSFDKDSKSIVFMGDKHFVVEPDYNLPHNYAFLKNAIQQIAAQPKNSFLAYLSKTHLYNSSLQESAKGAAKGGVKGIDNGNMKLNEKEDRVFPMDSAILLSNTIRLTWPADAKVYGMKLIVINTITKDTLYNEPAPAKLQIDKKIDTEGTYNWFLYSKLENKKTIDRVFIKPDAKMANKLKDNLAQFKNSIASLSEELQALVLEDYLSENRILEN